MPPQPGYRGIRRTPSRELILDAAELLFATDNFTAVSIDDIVNRAGVAKGTFYNHFIDKRDLGHHLALRIRTDLRDQIAVAKGKALDPAMNLAIAVSSFLNLAVLNANRAIILVTLLVGATQTEASMNRPIRTNLEKGISSGRLQIENIDSALTYTIGITVAGIHHIVREGVSEKTSGFVEQLIVSLLLGLGLKRAESSKIVKAALTQCFSDTSLEAQ